MISVQGVTPVVAILCKFAELKVDNFQFLPVYWVEVSISCHLQYRHTECILGEASDDRETALTGMY